MKLSTRIERRISFGLLALALGTELDCASPGTRPSYADYPVSWPEMVGMIENEQTTLATFERLGPFSTQLKSNIGIRIGQDVVVGDLLIPKGEPEAPLAVIVHGNRSHKEAHRFQAMKLASFGIYAFVVQLPSAGNWQENASMIERLVRCLAAKPSLLHQHIDPAAIVMVGHSFGGGTVSLALSRGAPAKGLVLLDPAIFSDEVETALGNVTKPVMLLGSDRDIFHARRRAAFGDRVKGEFGELSVVGATHDDAQSPSMYALAAFGIDPFTSRARQTTFSAALTASVIAIAANGNLDFARRAFKAPLAAGIFKNPTWRQGAPMASKAPLSARDAD